MNDFRFIRKNWDDLVARDYLAGAIYNAVAYAAGKESSGDYMVRFRAGGGGVYIAYWEDKASFMWPHVGPREVRAAHIQIGSPVLKPLSWRLDYTEHDFVEDYDALLYWCPRENGMPYARDLDSTYTREWCLYEGVYMWTRLRSWNPEGDDGKPKYRLFGEPRRARIVEEMLEASKMGARR